MSFVDPYARCTPDLDDPSSNLVDLTPDDAADIQYGVKGLRIWNDNNAAATIKVTTVAGHDVSFKVPPMSLWLEPLRIRRLWATGTDAGVTVQGYTDLPQVLNTLA